MPVHPWTILAPIAKSVASPSRSKFAAGIRRASLVLAITGALLGPTVSSAPGAVAAKTVADDVVSTKINSRTTFDVLANDPAGWSLVDHTDPAHGELTLHGNEFDYLPNANFVGADAFTYRARRGSAEPLTGTVTIEVTGRVTSVESRDDTLQTDEDVPGTIYVLANDGLGPDGLPLIVTIEHAPEHGSAEVQADNSVRYTPAANWFGTDSFSYFAGDGSTSDSATVSITVNSIDDAPTAVDDAAFIRQDSSASIDVLANDWESDGDEFGFAGNTQPAAGTASWSSVDHMIIYAPNPGFFGVDQFTYSIADFDGTGTATVTVTVNGAPTPQDDVASTSQSTPVDVPVLANDADPESDALTVASVGNAAHGKVTINPDSTVRYEPNRHFVGQDSFTYSARDASGNTRDATVTMTVSGSPGSAGGAVDDEFLILEDSPGNTLDVLSNDDSGGGTPSISIDTTPAHGTLTLDAMQSITYVPDPGYIGRDGFTYSISNGGNPRSSATVSIEIQEVNDAPVAAPDAATGDEDSEIVIDVLANDTDEEGGDLSVDSVASPGNGKARIRKDGNIAYVPNADFSGVDTFDYVVSDGQGGTASSTITVTVNPINDAPQARDDRAHAEIGASIVIDALANDHDPDGPYALLTITRQPEHGTASITYSNTIAYTPMPKYEGYDTIEYQYSDGLETATASISIAVGNVNSAPVAKDDRVETTTGESVTIDVRANDKDADGDEMIVYGLTQPDHGEAAVENGVVTYTPEPGFVGTDSFTYKVRDGKSGRDKATVQVTVNPTKDRRSSDE
jgi:large repetitive protein